MTHKHLFIGLYLGGRPGQRRVSLVPGAPPPRLRLPKYHSAAHRPWPTPRGTSVELGDAAREPGPRLGRAGAPHRRRQPHASPGRSERREAALTCSLGRRLSPLQTALQKR